jgi:glutamate carboxypeptidase
MAESPSNDASALDACAAALAAIGKDVLGAAPERLDHGILRWTFGGTPRVLLLGHYDTVWPLGTTTRWPFAVDGDHATGPGVFDMKAGIVQGLFAVASLASRDGVAILLNADEETGSHRSRETIEREARACAAVLVLEPAAGEAVKVARKGVSSYDLIAEGRASHAGLDPGSGVNATVEIAHQVLALKGIARGDTTVTPTTCESGTAMNVVPASARLHVDVRASSIAEQQRADDEIRRLSPVLPGARLRVEGGQNRAPLEQDMSRDLYALCRKVASGLGLAEPGGVAVGGGSDGNFTAGAGVPTLDGLGAVGDGAHAEGEHVVVSRMAERAAIVAALIDALRT